MPDGPTDHLVKIVLDTGRYVVVDKPSGLLSVPGKGPEKADCVRNRVAAMYPDATGPMTVHRLDQDTSGLIVVALDADAQRAMSQVFEHRRVTKRYIAVVEGELKEHAGLIDLPLRIDWPNRPRHIVAEDGRASQTRYKVLGVEDGNTRVEFTPITGRGHQLRVHAADERGLGAPILGDPLYGDTSKAPRLLLHAWSLEYKDPFTGELLHITSDPQF
ncbi:MAG: RluA family pseudouridine synthase [Phycisphaera sp.]|nr:MAG: RluA family pseudouridine synthase [Phycisphaera sp.]